MKHDGLLIAIFLIVGLVMPAVIFMRVYNTAFSGMRTKNTQQTPSRKDTEKPLDEDQHITD